MIDLKGKRILFLEGENMLIPVLEKAKKYGVYSIIVNTYDTEKNPAKLVEGCKSIVSVALSYAQGEFDESRLHISRYAQGADYHHVVKERLYRLPDYLHLLEKPSFLACFAKFSKLILASCLKYLSLQA